MKRVRGWICFDDGALRDVFLLSNQNLSRFLRRLKYYMEDYHRIKERRKIKHNKTELTEELLAR